LNDAPSGMTPQFGESYVWGINNVSNMAQARQAFAYWAQQLRDRLDEKRKSPK